MDDTYQPEVKTIHFPSGKSAKLIETLPTVSANSISEWLELPPTRFTLVVHGGASDMTEMYQNKMRALLRDSLIRFAQDNYALVADGGTDTGIMHVIGDAYRDAGAGFPLIGITVDDGVTYPTGPLPDGGRWRLNDSHTHFVIVNAGNFGEESQVLVGFARVGGNRSLALAINGGEITRAEIEMQARIGTPVITLKGTGRYADDLANAAPGSELRHPFEESVTMLEVFDVETQTPEELYHLIRKLLLS